MKITLPWPEAIRHLTLLTIGWFLLCVMIGLYKTFDLLEASTETNQISQILGGLKISSITFFIGTAAISSVPVIFSLNKKREH
jgi:hypothetical protein